MDQKETGSMQEPPEDFQIENGVLLSYKGSAERAIVPEGVRKIAENAFFRSGFYSVVLPRSVEEIERGAFSNCHFLHIVILRSPTAKVIKDTFLMCGEIDRIFVPHVEQVEYGATGYNHTINGVVFACDGAFFLNPYGRLEAYCESESTPVLPKETTAIYKYVFAGNTDLSSISLPDTCAYICEGAFAKCTSLTSVRFPQSIKRLDKMAFSGCSSLTQVELPSGITKIEEYTFACCRALERIVIPEGVERIDKFAFNGCTSLSEVVLPSSLVAIGEGAFQNCKRLKNIHLPSGIKEIEKNVFEGCDALASLPIPRSITTVKRGVFDALKNAESITLPDSVQMIEDCALMGFDMKELHLPEGLWSIGSGAFADCGNLKRVYISGEKNVSLGSSVFRGVPTGLEIFFGGDSETWERMIAPKEQTQSYYDSGCNGGAPGVYSDTYLVLPLGHELLWDFVCTVFCEKDGKTLVCHGGKSGIHISSSSPYDQ